MRKMGRYARLTPYPEPPTIGNISTIGARALLAAAMISFVDTSCGSVTLMRNGPPFTTAPRASSSSRNAPA
jgi:hypothetical protein